MQLSFIVPTHLMPIRFCRRCLQSLATFKAAEIIEINGLSISEARNEGLRKARGEWVWFVDADDILMPEKLGGLGEETLRDIVNGDEFDILLMGVRTKWGRFGRKWDVVPPKLNGVMSREELKTLNDNLLFRYAWNKIYRRSFLVKNDIWFEKGTEPCEDVIFNLKCVKAGARWKSLSQVGYIYWKRLGSSVFRYCPTLEKACRRENEMWKGLRDEKYMASEEEISQKVLMNDGFKNPSLRWRIWYIGAKLRRLMRFIGI